MGTKVQHKMYLSTNYPMRDLNENASSDSWLSHHGNKTFGQYYNIFPARPAIEGYAGYEREQLRQTILKHETVFRQQLQELHRLYKIQMDMMNEVRSKEPSKHLKPIGTSQSSIFALPSIDNKIRWHDSGLPLVDFTHHISSASGADSIQSHFSSMNVKIMQSGCGSTDNESRFKEYESLESKCKKLQRRLFDLELPADECINDEGQGASGGSGIKNCSPNGNCQVASEKNGYLSTHNGAYSICNADALSSNMNLRRNLGLTDLNKPVQVEEASSIASVDILGNVTSSREGIQKIDLSASSYSGFLAKETSQSPTKEKHDGVSLHNLHLEHGKREKGWLPYTFNPGQHTSNKNSENEGFHCDLLPAKYESSQIGCQGADRNRREQSSKKTIFGVEIFHRNQDSSVIASENGSARLVHGREIARDKSLVNNNLRSVPSLRAEPSYQNSPCLVSQMESKESQVFHESVSFGNLNGISHSNSKQAPDRSLTSNFRCSSWLWKSESVEVANAVLPKSCQNGAISDSKTICNDDIKEEENPRGRLSWLRDTSFCDGKYSKERDGSDRVNLNFLQNQSQQFAVKANSTMGPSQSFISSLMTNSHAHDAEDRRSEVGGCSSRKVIGVPIIEMPMSKDLSSASFASKPSCALEINGSNSFRPGLLLADLNHDPMPSDSGEIQHLKTVDAKEGSVDCSANLRDHIDLNVSVTEEESQLTHFSPGTKVKTAFEIDLEAPVVLDSESDITSGGEFVESRLKEQLDPLKDESGEYFHEGFVKVAAEALIAISSSHMHNIQVDDTHPHLEASLSNALHWFTEIITSDMVEIENDASLSVGMKSTDREDSIYKGIDYFEYMTLNLTEAKLEEYHYEPEVIENTRDEVILPRRPRRGQARRGRQRKDFQRDVLPGLVSLSRNDVTEDLQTIEGLVRATGGIWQSSLSLRNSPKGRGGRGRKRSAPTATTPTVNATSPTETAVIPTQSQQPKCMETGLEKTRLTGWGKRTRRPPRQRCPTNHPPFSITISRAQ
ncbi:uncharacterized protein LOC8281272 isoform X1 [Ricinus communis]|uniref:uncharacterized protein LOC8281272 isoform X1 n=1 Tax=Ricinus communis TaxID=3988 RepID=UPI00201AA7FF|nr:uncharacterized protein LOC8281272 isoform X1 [Ricinus communis]XP_015583141.2 uncharacterized protein LOC8281272 isoform X1 [Ricinus communis]